MLPTAVTTCVEWPVRPGPLGTESSRLGSTWPGELVPPGAGDTARRQSRCPVPRPACPDLPIEGDPAGPRRRGVPSGRPADPAIGCPPRWPDMEDRGCRWACPDVVDNPGRGPRRSAAVRGPPRPSHPPPTPPPPPSPSPPPPTPPPPPPPSPPPHPPPPPPTNPPPPPVSCQPGRAVPVHTVIAVASSARSCSKPTNRPTCTRVVRVAASAGRRC